MHEHEHEHEQACACARARAACACACCVLCAACCVLRAACARAGCACACAHTCVPARVRVRGRLRARACVRASRLLARNAKIEPVARVVLDDKEAARVARHVQNGREHLCGRRRGEDRARHRSRQHPLAHPPSVRRLVPGATARQNGHLCQAAPNNGEQM
eukprot:2433751-Pleurochrysis_carterae.AAC.3